MTVEEYWRRWSWNEDDERRAVTRLEVQAASIMKRLKFDANPRAGVGKK